MLPETENLCLINENVSKWRGYGKKLNHFHVFISLTKCAKETGVAEFIITLVLPKKKKKTFCSILCRSVS